jgi:hypothetical protein
MVDFERQLRDLGKDIFESFVHQYLTSAFPAAGIKRADGSGGDDGIDSFSGSLASGPAIWQCKHFPDRIRKTQKQQIVHSIERAFEQNPPSIWTLCVPLNLRTAEHKWFQEEVVAQWGGPNRITLLQASDFLGELLRNRTLRDHFFPENAITELRSLRRTAILGEERTSKEAENILVEVAQEYLSGKMDLDPRLEAVIEVGGSLRQRNSNDRAGLVASISDAQKTLHLFAKDSASYNLDPINVTMLLNAPEGAALQEALDLGKPFTLQLGKLAEITSSSPLLNQFFPATDISKASLEIKPRLPEAISARVVPLRLIAGEGASARELFYVPFRPIRMGFREVALLSETLLPIEIELTLKMPPNRGASLRLAPKLVGADIQQLDQVLQFFQELERSNRLEVMSVETSEPLLNQNGGFKSNLTIPQWITKLAADAAIVSREFGIPLKFPAAVAAADARELMELVRIATGIDFYDVYLNGNLTLTPERREFIRGQLIQGEFAVKVDSPPGGRLLNALGTPIDPGHVAFFAEKAKFADAEKLNTAVDEASDGDPVPIRFHCEGPCHWERIRDGIGETALRK